MRNDPRQTLSGAGGRAHARVGDVFIVYCVLVLGEGSAQGLEADVSGAGGKGARRD